jgi:Protein of unknown function (DUF2924)
MKNSTFRSDVKTFAASLDRLCVLQTDELVEQWRELFRSEPPNRLRRRVMIHALAYRLQERALGGLKPATRRQLERIASDAGARRPIAVDSKRLAKRGAVLIREWHGTKHQVTALKEGFMFQGKRFQSLSKIASEITGTRWSGPLFFGLKNSRQEHQDGAR